MMPIFDDLAPWYGAELIQAFCVEIPERLQIEGIKRLRLRFVQVPLREFPPFPYGSVYRESVSVEPELPEEPLGEFPALISTSISSVKFAGLPQN